MTGGKSDAFTKTEIASTGYALIAITSSIAIGRIGTHFITPKRITFEDGFVCLAYICNVAMCSLYIALAPTAEKLMDVGSGKVAPYADMKNDIQLTARRYFVAPILFWAILWSIKFSFLLLYRKLLAGIPKVYTWMWWGIVLICVGTQGGNFTAYFTACSDIHFLVNGGCKDMTMARQLTSLLYSYGADTITNVLIIALPIRLTWNLQMAPGKKIGLIALFASGILCIVIATLRVAQITHNVIEHSQGIDGTWLAIWGMVECSIAVIVGFCPAFAVLIRVVRDKKSSYGLYGYRNQPPSRYAEGTHPGQFKMHALSNRTSRSKKQGLDSIWVDETGSQEGFASGAGYDGIIVTTTVKQDHGPVQT